jgi:DNA end-binding protein Ku
MAARSTWKGFLKLSLVSVPVKAYTASAGSKGEIHLNQLHKECNSRIQYRKCCPLHGEVDKDSIVSGYEFAKDQYVVVDPDEIDKLRTPSDKAINIDTFVPPDELDPIYLTERTYYLVPDGPVGQKPYTLLLKAMKEKGKYGIAQVVFSGREQLVLLRPMDGVLAMTVLNFQGQVQTPDVVSSEVTEAAVTDEELTLAKTLVDASTRREFDFGTYKDKYHDKLSQLIQAKVEGKEIVAPPAQEESQVINLMDALRQSVAKVQLESSLETDRPPKQMAPSVQPEAAQKRKRKLG